MMGIAYLVSQLAGVSLLDFNAFSDLHNIFPNAKKSSIRGMNALKIDSFDADDFLTLSSKHCISRVESAQNGDMIVFLV